MLTCQGLYLLLSVFAIDFFFFFFFLVAYDKEAHRATEAREKAEVSLGAKNVLTIWQRRTYERLIKCQCLLFYDVL